MTILPEDCPMIAHLIYGHVILKTKKLTWEKAGIRVNKPIPETATSIYASALDDGMKMIPTYSRGDVSRWIVRTADAVIRWLEAITAPLIPHREVMIRIFEPSLIPIRRNPNRPDYRFSVQVQVFHKGESVCSYYLL